MAATKSKFWNPFKSNVATASSAPAPEPARLPPPIAPPFNEMSVRISNFRAILHNLVGCLANAAESIDQNELANSQAEVSLRKQGPLVRARTPPRRNHGEVILAESREGKMEESFGWAGGSAYSMPPPASQARSSTARIRSSIRFDTPATEQLLPTGGTVAPPSTELAETQAGQTKDRGLEKYSDWASSSITALPIRKDRLYRSQPVVSIASNGTELDYEVLKNGETISPVIVLSAVAFEKYNAIHSGSMTESSRDITDREIGGGVNVATVEAVPDARGALETRANIVRTSITEIGYRMEIGESQEETTESKSSCRTFCCF